MRRRGDGVEVNATISALPNTVDVEGSQRDEDGLDLLRSARIARVERRGRVLHTVPQRDDVAPVEIKILRRVRPESSRRPLRHRRDVCASGVLVYFHAVLHWFLHVA